MIGSHDFDEDTFPDLEKEDCIDIFWVPDMAMFSPPYPFLLYILVLTWTRFWAFGLPDELIGSLVS